MHQMRNSKRAIPASQTRELLQRGEFGFLSTCGSDGVPYGVPLSYCLFDDAIYFHCAVDGRKLQNLRENDRISFCVVGQTEVLPAQFATRYESVIVAGRTEEVFAAEKQRALEGLVDKYSPGHRPAGQTYIEAARDRTRVFRIDIEEICGKARR
jgi:nitroimidazol reductase NimA-like FMN-containing flavoprotein (pyridoxamine 5'-phosphate oxidase superfamily)